MTQLLPFLGLCLLITVTPGLDTAVLLRSVLRGGSPAGLRTAIGCAAGLFVHATLVALGLAELLLRSETAFEVLKLAGAALFSLTGLGLVALAAGRVRPLLRSPRVRRVQDALLGTTLVALGIRVATE